MTSPPLPRPVAILGWCFAGYGGLLVVMGLISFVTAPWMVHEVSRSMPMGLGRMFAPVFAHFREITLFQLALGAVMTVSAVALLQLKAWGRALLEVVVWVALAYMLGFGGYYMYFAITSHSGTFAFVMLGVMAGSTIMYAIPLGIAIRVLRSETVRSAVS